MDTLHLVWAAAFNDKVKGYEEYMAEFRAMMAHPDHRRRRGLNGAGEPEVERAFLRKAILHADGIAELYKRASDIGRKDRPNTDQASDR